MLWKSKEKSASKLSRDSILRQFWEQCQNEAKEIYLRPSHKRTSVLHDWELRLFYILYLHSYHTALQTQNVTALPFSHVLEQNQNCEESFGSTTTTPWPNPNKRPLLIFEFFTFTWGILDTIDHRAMCIPGGICQAESHQNHRFQYLKACLRNIIMENCLTDRKFSHSSAYSRIYLWSDPSQRSSYLDSLIHFYLLMNFIYFGLKMYISIVHWVL